MNPQDAAYSQTDDSGRIETLTYLKESISLRLASELSKKLDRYCSMTGVSKNGVISIAISDFLAERISN